MRWEFFRKGETPEPVPKWEITTLSNYGEEFELKRREDFHLSELLEENGPAVEIAGPTDRGFIFHELDPKTGRINTVDLYSRKIFKSNLYPGTPTFHSTTGVFSHFYGLNDFIADAREMPVKKEAVRIVYCSCFGEIAPRGVQEIQEAGQGSKIPEQERIRAAEDIKKRLEFDELIKNTRKLRQDAIREVWNMLGNGGYLVWQGGHLEDVAFAQSIGFRLVQSEKSLGGKDKVIHAVLKKEIIS